MQTVLFKPFAGSLSFATFKFLIMTNSSYQHTVHQRHESMLKDPPVAGYVDMWSNETGTSAVHTFRGPGPVHSVHLSTHGRQLIAVNDNIIRVEHQTDQPNPEWKQQCMLELPTKVRNCFCPWYSVGKDNFFLFTTARMHLWRQFQNF